MISLSYEFHNPIKLISGRLAVHQLSHELDQRNASRPIIITDKVCADSGVIKRMIKAFGGTRVVIGAVWNNAGAGSLPDLTAEIAFIYRETKCDSIIAAGGEAVFDIAERACREIAFADGGCTKNTGTLPYFAVPSDGRAAFRASSSCYCPERDINSLLPDIMVLDPKMMVPPPAAITAETGIEALAVSIETALGDSAGPVGRAFAHASVKNISENLLRAVKRPWRRDTIFALANASAHAGFASSGNAVGTVLSFAESLSSLCGISRGVLCAILLPNFMKYTLERSREEAARLLVPLGGSEKFAVTYAENRASASLAIVREILSAVQKKCGMPETLEKAGVEKEKLFEAAALMLDDDDHPLNSDDAIKDEFMEMLEKAY